MKETFLYQGTSKMCSSSGAIPRTTLGRNFFDVTACLLISSHPPPWPISAPGLRQTCFANHFQTFYC